MTAIPPVVDRETWQKEVDALLVREKAHTRAGVSFAILTTGAWEEVAPFVAFMGYTEPWFSVRETAPPIGGDMGYLQCYVREGAHLASPTSTDDTPEEALAGDTVHADYGDLGAITCRFE